MVRRRNFIFPQLFSSLVSSMWMFLADVELLLYSSRVDFIGSSTRFFPFVLDHGLENKSNQAQDKINKFPLFLYDSYIMEIRYRQLWGTRCGVVECWYRVAGGIYPFCCMVHVVDVLRTIFCLLTPLILSFHIDSPSNLDRCHVFPRNVIFVSFFSLTFFQPYDFLWLSVDVPDCCNTLNLNS